MSYEMSVKFIDGYIEVHSDGEKSYDSAVKLWTEITRVCVEHDCYKVLGIANSTRPMPTMAALNHEKLFKDFAVTRKYKIAWVELNKDAVGSIKFLETVLLNRGMLNGMLFDDVDKARQWLLRD